MKCEEDICEVVISGDTHKFKVKCCQSKDTLYRYTLEVIMGEDGTNFKGVMAVLLNPSNAGLRNKKGRIKLDRSSRNLIRLCYLKGYTFLVICNLFPYRAPNPEKLVIGDETLKLNDDILKKYVSNYSEVICAWGEGHKIKRSYYRNRIEKIKKILNNTKLLKIGDSMVKNEYPRHPCWINPYEENLVPYSLYPISR